MPFIVPTAYLMYKMKDMQTKAPYLRVNYLKKIYYARFISYPTIFLISNFLIF
jgi:hypothetical protein